MQDKQVFFRAYLGPSKTQCAVYADKSGTVYSDRYNVSDEKPNSRVLLVDIFHTARAFVLQFCLGFFQLCVMGSVSLTAYVPRKSGRQENKVYLELTED